MSNAQIKNESARIRALIKHWCPKSCHREPKDVQFLRAFLCLAACCAQQKMVLDGKQPIRPLDSFPDPSFGFENSPTGLKPEQKTDAHPLRMRQDYPHQCESCAYFRDRKPFDKPERQYDHAKHWCVKNGFATMPAALRCGGDDYEAVHRQARKIIPREKLIEGRWYVGRGRNANVALWTRMGKSDRFTFLTISFKFGQPDVKDEGYYAEHDGCFQPFMLIDEGLNLQAVGTDAGWDQHYSKILSI